MHTISYSTSGFVDRDVEAALDAIAAAGFAHAELLGQRPHITAPPTGQALRDFRQRLAARGLSARTVHAPLERNVLGAPDEDWRQEVAAVLANYIRFAGAVGAGDIIIHPIPNPRFVSEPNHPTIPDRMRQAARRSLDELVPVAQAAGVRILLENLPYVVPYPYPLWHMGELRPLVDEYPAAQVGLVIDTGHAWTGRFDPVAEIRTAGTRLGGTHLQDVDAQAPNDDHWMPTHGGLDWDAIRRALAEVNYQGPWTFEVITPRRGESQDELARQTRQLATAWGL